jgi:choline kinase
MLVWYYPWSDGIAMSIKKELLNELTEYQLRQLAESKGIAFTLNTVQKKYYENWAEKDKLVDLMSTNRQITVPEIEKFIQSQKC